MSDFSQRLVAVGKRELSTARDSSVANAPVTSVGFVGKGDADKFLPCEVERSGFCVEGKDFRGGECGDEFDKLCIRFYDTVVCFDVS